MSLMTMLTRSFRTSLAIGSVQRSLFTGPVATFKATPVTLAMPAKRKKKVDPMQARMREERKRKKLQKAMRQLNKKERIPKPLREMEIDASLAEESQGVRKRPEVTLTEEQKEYRAFMVKEWNRFANRRHRHEIMEHDAILSARVRALNELREESFDLYAKAIKLDDRLLGFKAEGPTATPPPLASKAEEEHLVDGHYEDTTRKYEVQYEDAKKHLDQMMSMQQKRKKKKKAEEE